MCVSTGIARVKEALETNDWAADEDQEDQEDFGSVDADDIVFSSDGVDAELAGFQGEMFGLKMALVSKSEKDSDHEDEVTHGEGTSAAEGQQEVDVEGLELLMLRMQALRGGS
jgi:hypothetical protein